MVTPGTLGEHKLVANTAEVSFLTYFLVFTVTNACLASIMTQMQWLIFIRRLLFKSILNNRGQFRGRCTRNTYVYRKLNNYASLD